MKALLITSLLFSLPAGAHERIPAHEPSADDPQPPDPAAIAAERYRNQTELFQQIMSELATNEFFAGRRIEFPFRGKVNVIDRTGETVWYKKTTTIPKTPNVATLAGLLGAANGNAKMNIKIRVTYREFDENGKTTEEIWEIESGAFLQAQLGMDEAMSKQHK